MRKAAALRRLPIRLDRVDLVIAVVDGLVAMHFVEDEVFEFRTEMGSVADTRAGEIGLRFSGDIARIPAIGLAGDGIRDVADQDEGRCFRKRVRKRRGRIGIDQHVAFLDLLESTDRRTVEAYPVGLPVTIYP